MTEPIADVIACPVTETLASASMEGAPTAEVIETPVNVTMAPATTLGEPIAEVIGYINW